VDVNKSGKHKSSGKNYTCEKFYNTGSRLKVLKLFMTVIYECSKQARAFAIDKPVQPCLMFAGKARRLL
jgi:hypothetical protein